MVPWNFVFRRWILHDYLSKPTVVYGLDFRNVPFGAEILLASIDSSCKDVMSPKRTTAINLPGQDFHGAQWTQKMNTKIRSKSHNRIGRWMILGLESRRDLESIVYDSHFGLA